MSRSTRVKSAAQLLAAVALAVAVMAAAQGCGTGSRCGPERGRVAKVTDGDTIELETGEKIRYLLVDTPESTNELECYGEEAKEFNRSLVLGAEVELRYDVECTDRFDRLLAYVTVDGREVNRLLLERGYACVLHISPNGDEVVEEYEAIEDAARTGNRGLWGFCSTRPC